MRVTPTRALLVIAVFAAIAAPLVAVGATASTDNSIPGVKLPASPVSGTLDSSALTNDWNDVYAVRLSTNQRLSVDLSGATGTDFGVWVWRPGTKQISDSPDGVVAASHTLDTTAEKIRYPASQPGTYYVDVFTSPTSAVNSGSYTLKWSVTTVPTPVTYFSAPKTIEYDTPSTIVCTATVSGAPLKGAKVLWQSRRAGTSTWSSRNLGTDRMPTAVTSSTGRVSVVVKPAAHYEYRYVIWPTESTGWKMGPAIPVSPKVRLGAPRVTPATKAVGKSFSVWGYLTPRHTAGAKHVTIVATQGSTVVRRGAVSYDYVTASGAQATRYATTMSLPRKGTWKLVAVTPTDDLHAATQSTALSVKIP